MFFNLKHVSKRIFSWKKYSAQFLKRFILIHQFPEIRIVFWKNEKNLNFFETCFLDYCTHQSVFQCIPRITVPPNSPKFSIFCIFPSQWTLERFKDYCSLECMISQLFVCFLITYQFNSCPKEVKFAPSPFATKDTVVNFIKKRMISEKGAWLREKHVSKQIFILKHVSESFWQKWFFQQKTCFKLKIRKINILDQNMFQNMF